MISSYRAIETSDNGFKDELDMIRCCLTVNLKGIEQLLNHLKNASTIPGLNRKFDIFKHQSNLLVNSFKIRQLDHVADRWNVFNEAVFRKTNRSTFELYLKNQLTSTNQSMRTCRIFSFTSDCWLMYDEIGCNPSRARKYSKEVNA